MERPGGGAPQRGGAGVSPIVQVEEVAMSAGTSSGLSVWRSRIEWSRLLAA
jgi:hypothetical protein